MQPLDSQALETLFLSARTHNVFKPEFLDDAMLKRLFDLLRMGPTSANCQPARFVFLRSLEAKKRLEPCLSPGNREKTMAAPVTVIVATDGRFDEQMPKVFPNAPKIFEGMSDEVRSWALLQNGSLQAAYLIMAARALGLDCGPMGGFDRKKLDAEFFADSAWRSILLVNLGHGEPSKLFPRNPRLDFGEACRIL